jgi:hypothetical protein
MTKSIKIVIGVVVLLLIVTGAIILKKSWEESSNSVANQQINNIQPTQQINNTIKNMSNLDPKIQALVDQYNEAKAKLSTGAASGNLSTATPEDVTVLDQMDQITTKLEKYDTEAPKASVSVTANGYELTVLINGKDTGIQGGGSTGLRLNYADSVMSLVTRPELRDQTFILQKGQNDIKVTYKKVGSSVNRLSLVLNAYDTNDEVLTIHAENKTEGAIEKTFTLDSKKPSDFKTITVVE